MLDHDHIEHAAEPSWRRFLRFWVRVGQGFARNRCAIRASALAYSSLLAFVPLLAMVIGISSSVLKDNAIEIQSWIDDLLVHLVPQLMNNPEFEDKKNEVVASLQGMIDKVNSGAVSAAGTIGLLALILFMVARVEETLNDIWGVTQGRSWYARLVNYWAAISLGPILIFAGIAYSTTLHLGVTRSWLQGLPLIGSFMVSLIPLPFLCGACAVLYGLMPNTKVAWKSAAVGGLVAGFLWHLNNTLSILFVSQLTRDTTIYGPVSIVPVFMVAMYFFWMILLFGAQAAYTFQNRRSYLTAHQVERVHQDGRELVALLLMIETGRNFYRGRPAPTVDELGARLEVPGQLVSRVAGHLIQTRLLVELNQGEECAGFLPARPLDLIRVADILDAMRRGVGGRPPARTTANREIADAILNRVIQAERQAGNTTLLEVVKDEDSRWEEQLKAGRSVTPPTGDTTTDVQE